MKVEAKTSTKQLHSTDKSFRYVIQRAPKVTSYFIGSAPNNISYKQDLRMRTISSLKPLITMHQKLQKSPSAMFLHNSKQPSSENSRHAFSFRKTSSKRPCFQDHLSQTKSNNQFNLMKEHENTCQHSNDLTIEKINFLECKKKYNLLECNWF